MLSPRTVLRPTRSTQDNMMQSDNPFAFKPRSRPTLPPQPLDGGVILGDEDEVDVTKADGGGVLCIEEELRRQLAQAAERETHLLSRVQTLEQRLLTNDDDWKEELMRKTREVDRLRARCNDLSLALVMSNGPTNPSNSNGECVGLNLAALSISNDADPTPLCQSSACQQEVQELRASLKEVRQKLRAARGITNPFVAASPVAGKAQSVQGSLSPIPGSPLLNLGWKRGRKGPEAWVLSPRVGTAPPELTVEAALLPGMKRLRLQTGDVPDCDATPPRGSPFLSDGRDFDVSPQPGTGSAAGPAAPPRTMISATA